MNFNEQKKQFCFFWHILHPRWPKKKPKHAKCRIYNEMAYYVDIRHLMRFITNQSVKNINKALFFYYLCF